MAMHIIVSNTSEKLANDFRERIYLRRTPEELFVPEIVVVQSQGMSAWLDLQLSDPVAANVETPFLNSFVDEILTRFSPETDKPLMTEDWMFWRIFRSLQSDVSAYPEIARYISSGHRGMKVCQLAEKIAGLYDQYQIYHPRLLQDWRNLRGKSAGSWQARLFREISRDAAGRDERFSAFQAKEFTAKEVSGLPERVTLFGISALAPAYFEFFQKLGTVTEVWFYYLNPSQEYWSENETAKMSARKRCREEWADLQRGGNPDEHPNGNPLLTSLGRQGQDFFRYLNSLDEKPDEEALFMDHVAAGNDPDWQYQYEKWTMLGVLQEDILLNIYRNPASEDGDPGSGRPLTGISEPDGSVAVHLCHSELRQVEVLHDLLLDLMEKEHFEPRDILVMAPDIGKFEPYIHAVFGGSGSRFQGSYSIADRSRRSLNRCADALLKTLKLLEGKFGASEVFDLFENKDIAERWGIGGADLDEIRGWIAELGIRWGVDGTDHELHCGVKFEEFSWKHALDRLILGYAVAERDADQADEKVIPFDSSEGKNCVQTGNFIRFMQVLFAFREKIRGRYTFSEWCVLLESLLDQLFSAGPENYQELAALRGTLETLRENDLPMRSADGLPDLKLVMYLLEKFLAPTGRSEPFLRGKITFCSLMPMRSIPMPVIAVLGMDEQDFPRHDLSPGFNVVPASGQRAALERSRNSEDRYIFLEALLAARKHLLLFYQGKDRKTNKPRPPAMPLAELEDVLSATFPGCGEKWKTEHCLQAFDNRYYVKGTGLFSYSQENYRAAEAFSERRSAALFQNMLKDKDALYRINYPSLIANWAEGQEPETLHQASPAILERFFRNPCQFFLETAVGLRRNHDEVPVLEDTEKVLPDDLDRYQLRSLMLDQMLSGLEPGERQYQLLKKTNRLPVGAAGKQVYQTELEKIRLIPEEWLERYMRSSGINVDVNVGGFRIEGEIPVNEESMEPYVISRSNSVARDLISLRLRYLILCASGRPVTAHFWNQAAKCCQHLDPMGPESALEHLRKLLQYYFEGHRRPLPFFPKASLTVSPETKNWRDTQNYRDAFSGGSYSGRSDYEDPAVQLIFTKDALDRESPFLEEFGKIASDVFHFAKGRGSKKELKKDA